jgi:hypothetical protein
VRCDGPNGRAPWRKYTVRRDGGPGDDGRIRRYVRPQHFCASRADAGASPSHRGPVRDGISITPFVRGGVADWIAIFVLSARAVANTRTVCGLRTRIHGKGHGYWRILGHLARVPFTRPQESRECRCHRCLAATVGTATPMTFSCCADLGALNFGGLVRAASVG